MSRSGPNGWMSFEMRMRRRRFARCLLRADLALDDRALEQARAALAEARDLDSESTDIQPLEERLAALEASADAPAPAGSRSKRFIPIAAAALVLLTIGSAYGVHYYYWTDRGSDASDAPQQSAAAAPALAPSPAPVAATPAQRALRIIRETVIAQEGTPAIVPEPRSDVTTPAPPALAPPIAAPDPPPAEPPAVVAAMTVREEPRPVLPQPDRPREVATLPLDPAPALLSAPPPAGTPEPTATSGSLAAVPRPEPATAVVPKPPDETVTVRSVLARYEAAYSALDAGAASAVWPAVNRAALSRAFDGLSAQEVSLGNCDVSVNGTAAHATCSGRARWTPKVGGGERTEARRWEFELRKAGSGWRIERASAR